MEAWKKVSVLLCIFGVLKEFRPSEPYVTKYLNNPPMSFSLEEISDEFYPVSIYTAMVSLVFVFLLTDFLRYKPVIIFDGLCAVVVYIILIVGRSSLSVKVLEFFYGLFSACDVAYYAYIYAKVDKRHYQEVSGHTRAAYLIGRSVSGVVSQLYIFLYPYDYFTLNYLTLGGMILATTWALFLPSVEHSIYFNRGALNPNIDDLAYQQFIPENHLSRVKKSLSFLLRDFNSAVLNFYTLKWMFWWSLATAGYYQVLSYTQVLWEEILAEGNSTAVKNASVQMSELNGAVETTYTLLSAGSAYGCGIISVEWNRYGELALFICSIGLAALLYLMSQTTRILMAFGLYILYAVIYNGMITIANSEIAQNVNPDSHGLIFGFTTFLALVFQSILTTVASSGLLGERMKFVIYSGYFAVLGLVFAIIVTVRKFKSATYKPTSTDTNLNE